MPEVHAVAAWPTPCVEEERLPLLIPVEDGVELAGDRNRWKCSNQAGVLLTGERKTSLDASTGEPYARLLFQTSPAERHRSFSCRTGR